MRYFPCFIFIVLIFSFSTGCSTKEITNVEIVENDGFFLDRFPIKGNLASRITPIRIPLKDESGTKSVRQVISWLFFEPDSVTLKGRYEVINSLMKDDIPGTVIEEHNRLIVYKSHGLYEVDFCDVRGTSCTLTIEREGGIFWDTSELKAKPLNVSAAVIEYNLLPSGTRVQLGNTLYTHFDFSIENQEEYLADNRSNDFVNQILRGEF